MEIVIRSGSRPTNLSRVARASARNLVTNQTLQGSGDLVMRKAASVQTSESSPNDKLDPLQSIQRRIDELAGWLDENGARCHAEQRHLDEGTDERLYWHYGYLVALRDMQKLLLKGLTRH